MDPGKELTEAVEMIAQAHKTRIGRIFYALVFWIRKRRNRPIPFYRVECEGAAVGEPFELEHGTMYDMAEHEARGQMTAKVLLEGVRANAFEIIRSELINERWEKSLVQPRWIASLQ